MKLYNVKKSLNDLGDESENVFLPFELGDCLLAECEDPYPFQVERMIEQIVDKQSRLGHCPPERAAHFRPKNFS